jgi:hypothetical protein
MDSKTSPDPLPHSKETINPVSTKPIPIKGNKYLPTEYYNVVTFFMIMVIVALMGTIAFLIGFLFSIPACHPDYDDFICNDRIKNAYLNQTELVPCKQHQSGCYYLKYVFTYDKNSSCYHVDKDRTFGTDKINTTNYAFELGNSYKILLKLKDQTQCHPNIHQEEDKWTNAVIFLVIICVCATIATTAIIIIVIIWLTQRRIHIGKK